MKLGILGTGHVAGMLGSAWANAGHEITLGSRAPGSKRFALVYPNSSLAEHLQAALPGARVVKSLNTGAMSLMADPKKILDVVSTQSQTKELPMTSEPIRDPITDHL